MGEFMFATGIECSYPTIENGRWRRDQLAETEHYRYWRRDFELVREIGLKYLRYGLPLHLLTGAKITSTGPSRTTLCPQCSELEITPIIDLCHFGVPDWLENFQNPRLPEALAAFAKAFAERYGWVRFYTPVNEMYVTSRMSALDGVWNEQMRSERAFVTATRHSRGRAF